MLDVVLAVFSLALLTLFMGIVVWYIAVPDLTIIVVLVLLLAAYDFWRELRKPKNGRPDGEPPKTA